MTIKKIAFLGAIVVGVIGSNNALSPVQAATIGQLSAGSNNTVIDSDQNLDWLQLNQSINKSVAEIAASPNSGFRLATNTEVKQLFNGLVNSNAATFTQLFGKTLDLGITSFSLGLYPTDSSQTTANLAGAYIFGMPGFSLQGLLNPNDSAIAFSGAVPVAGVFQVRSIQTTQTQPVPEPLTIIGSGIALGFGANLKRKLAQKNTNKQQS